jgi:hypothetical protein
MSDLSDIEIKLTHDQVEIALRQELHDAIHCQKKEINVLERNNVDEEHEDLVYAKAFIRAAAVVLKYYSVPTDWKKLDEISDGK